MTSRTAAHTRENLVLSVLNREREGKAILSSGGDRKDFGDNRILPLQTTLTRFLDWQHIRNLNGARNTNLHAYPTHGNIGTGWGGYGFKRLFFGLNSLLPTSIDKLSSNPLPLLSGGARVHKTTLLMAWHHHLCNYFYLKKKKSHLTVFPNLFSSLIPSLVF